MKTTRTCQQASCTEPTSSGYCAFHHLEFVSGTDIFTGLLDAIGGLEGTALLRVIFDILDEPASEPLCRHDGRLGACYLTTSAGLPGFTRTPWELRAAVYSLGIPLN